MFCTVGPTLCMQASTSDALVMKELNSPGGLGKGWLGQMPQRDRIERGWKDPSRGMLLGRQQIGHVLDNLLFVAIEIASEFGAIQACLALFRG